MLGVDGREHNARVIQHLKRLFVQVFLEVAVRYWFDIGVLLLRVSLI